MKFEDLEAWQTARELTNFIYDLSRKPPLSKEFSLTDQLKRASISIMANLAEGFDRTHKREKIQFWNIARSSAGEVRSLLYLLSDQKLIPENDIYKLFELINTTGRLCKGLIRSYDKNN